MYNFYLLYLDCYYKLFCLYLYYLNNIMFIPLYNLCCLLNNNLYYMLLLYMFTNYFITILDFMFSL